MPTPQKNEKHDDYIQRCMAYPEMNDKHPDQKERYAVCEGMWQQHKTKSWVEDTLAKKEDDNA